MAKTVSTKPPSGMRDFLPIDVARRRYVAGVVTQVFERYGFVPLETPSIENLDVLTGKYGEDEKLIYRLLHRGETLQRALTKPDHDADDLADQALRYDLTVPLARVIAQYGDLPRYFKRYQIQPVWRADRPGKGRYREFYQCDVDAMGTESLIAEAEVCGAGCEVFDRLGFEDYTLHVNHRGLLRALIRHAGLGPEQESDALVAIDKLDKVGLDGVRKELASRGVEDSAADRILELVDQPGSNEEVLDRIDATLSDEDGKRCVGVLREFVVLAAATPAGPRVRIEPALARGLSYYTGPIFEIRVPDLAGSMAGGGRYDQLIGMFGKRQVPAVGLSLGFERIILVMAERGMYPPLRTGPQVVLCWRGVSSDAVLKVAHSLRSQGLVVDVFPDPVKLGKQVQYADSPGVKAPFVAIVGDQEMGSGTVTLKHLESGEQTTVPVAEVAKEVERRR